MGGLSKVPGAGAVELALPRTFAPDTSDQLTVTRDPGESVATTAVGVMTELADEPCAGVVRVVTGPITACVDEIANGGNHALLGAATMRA